MQQLLTKSQNSNCAVEMSSGMRVEMVMSDNGGIKRRLRCTLIVITVTASVSAATAAEAAASSHASIAKAATTASAITES